MSIILPFKISFKQFPDYPKIFFENLQTIILDFLKFS